MTDPILNHTANRQAIVDSLCILKNEDDSAKTASAAATNAGGAVAFDTGGGFTKFDWVVDVASCQTGATVSPWAIELQGSPSSSFGTPTVVLDQIQLGIAAQVNHTRGQAAGHHKRPASNDFGGYLYRYIRCYHRAGATPGTTGLDYSSFLTKSDS